MNKFGPKQKTEWIKWCDEHKDYFKTNSKGSSICEPCKIKRRKEYLKRMRNKIVTPEQEWTSLKYQKILKILSKSERRRRKLKHGR